MGSRLSAMESANEPASTKCVQKTGNALVSAWLAEDAGIVAQAPHMAAALVFCVFPLVIIYRWLR
jgi:hypothetical protein